jgi:hypothetical protein
MGNNRPTEPDIRDENECPNKPDITSLTTPLLTWSTPRLWEMRQGSPSWRSGMLRRSAPRANVV